MSRRRYIWDPASQQMVEVGADYQPEAREGHHRSEEEIYGRCVATDGTPLDTRKKHRDYMKANGLQMASDFTEHWQKKAAERANVESSPGQVRARREALARAMERTKR